MNEPTREDTAAFLALRHIRRRPGWTSKLTPSTRPTMPKARWRALAALCFVVGAVAGALLVDDGGRRVLVSGFGGLVALAVGMYVIETVWERRRARP